MPEDISEGESGDGSAPKAEINLMRALYDAYSDALNFINERVFDGELGDLVFTIQGERATTLNTYGVFCPKRWTVAGRERHEISLTAEAIRTDPHEVLGTIVHEMVHWSAHAAGEKDVSGRRFHNERFRKRAENYGYIVDERDPKLGYTRGRPDDFLKGVFAQCVEKFGLDRFREGFSRNRAKPSDKKPVKKIFKYKCPKCGIVARTGFGIALVCGRDGVAFSFADKPPEETDADQNAQTALPPWDQDLGDQ